VNQGYLTFTESEVLETGYRQQVVFGIHLT